MVDKNVTTAVILTFEEYGDFNEERKKMGLAKQFELPLFETPVFDKVNKHINADSIWLRISTNYIDRTVTIEDGAGSYE